MEKYYVPTIKVNSRIADLVLDGYHIEIEGYRYEELARKPKGRSIKRKLINTNTQERLIIYA